MGFFSDLFGTPVPSIDVKELNKKLVNGEQLHLLDVREPDEFQSGHIQGARLLPLGELRRRLNEVPKDSEIICICASGSRSVAATRALIGAGYHATNVSHGMMAWQMANLPIAKGMAGGSDRKRQF